MAIVWEAQERIAAFLQELQKRGWSESRNLEVEYRWTSGDIRKPATELADANLDAIFATAPPAVAALQQANRTVPIVFAVTSGFVASLAKPGGNIPAHSSVEGSAIFE